MSGPTDSSREKDGEKKKLEKGKESSIEKEQVAGKEVAGPSGVKPSSSREGNTNKSSSSYKGRREDDKIDRLASVIRESMLSMTSSMQNMGDSIANKVLESMQAISTAGARHEISDTEREMSDTSHQSGVEPSDGLFKNLSKDFWPVEKINPPVNEELATLVNSFLSKKIDSEVEKGLKDTHWPPENVEFLSTPKVNPEIWSLLSKEGKAADLKLQDVQSSLLTGIVSVVKVMGMLHDSVSSPEQFNPESAIKILGDSLALFGNVNLGLVKKRREEIRPHLQEDV